MPKFRNRFTSAGIATYPAGRHADGSNNLYLEVKEAGGSRKSEGRYFIYRLNRDGRVAWKSIGVWPAVSLKMARAKADAWNHAIFMGTDPWVVEAKDSDIRECARLYLDEVLVVKNQKSRNHWELTLSERYCAKILPKRVNEISVDDVLGLLKPIWQTKPATAGRVRGRIERILTYAKGRGWRSGENVAAWKDNLAGILPIQGHVTRHHPSIPYDKAPEFVERLRQRSGVAARCLEFLILTATRANEAVGCQFDEIDFERAIWVVPASRMKLKREHVIPLSDRALAIIREMEGFRVNEFVFAGMKTGQHVSHTALARIMEAHGATVHGWRSTFSDWASEMTTHSTEAIEFSLAHGIPNKVRAAYRRYRALDKRKALMEDWGRYLEGMEAKVIQLRA